MSDEPSAISDKKWEALARLNYPLHYLIWLREHSLLEKRLNSLISVSGDIDRDKLEQLDIRGRTPLMLAIALGDTISTRMLISIGANITIKNNEGWTTIQEAIATGDPEMIQIVLKHGNHQRFDDRVTDVYNLLKLLEESPDFYVEMKWEIFSWVPLLTKICPSDTCKIYKKGSKLRIDTTFLGFKDGNWEHGNMSVVFIGQNQSTKFFEIDHETRCVYVEEIKKINPKIQIPLSKKKIYKKLSKPIVSFDIGPKDISFERNKSGIWGWQHDKSEVINGYNCQVFKANNIELVTKSRTEHMNEVQKAKEKNSKNLIKSIFALSEVKHSSKSEREITMAEYFDELIDVRGTFIRKPIEQTSRVTKIKTNLWICEKYPLNLKEQIIPIIDLLTVTSSHFAKLKNFIKMQFPSGFPVKIEVPLYRICNAQVTFGNLFGLDKRVKGVKTIVSYGKKFCIIKDTVFDPPKGYEMLDYRNEVSQEDNEKLLQIAINRSLIETEIAKENQREYDEQVKIEKEMIEKVLKLSLNNK